MNKSFWQFTFVCALFVSAVNSTFIKWRLIIASISISRIIAGDTIYGAQAKEC